MDPDDEAVDHTSGKVRVDGSIYVTTRVSCCFVPAFFAELAVDAAFIRRGWYPHVAPFAAPGKILWGTSPSARLRASADVSGSIAPSTVGAWAPRNHRDHKLVTQRRAAPSGRWAGKDGRGGNPSATRRLSTVPDGIFWVSLGQHSSISIKLEQLASAVAGGGAITAFRMS